MSRQHIYKKRGGLQQLPINNAKLDWFLASQSKFTDKLPLHPFPGSLKFYISILWTIWSL